MRDFSKRGRFKRRLPVLEHKYIYNSPKPDSQGTFPLLLSVMLANSPFLQSAVFTWLYCTLVMKREYFGEAAWQGTISRSRSQPYALWCGAVCLADEIPVQYKEAAPFESCSDATHSDTKADCMLTGKMACTAILRRSWCVLESLS